MQPGLLREEIVISAATGGKDEVGGIEETWATIADGTVPARVQSDNEKEGIDQDRRGVRERLKMTIRTRGDLNNEMRVTWASKTYEIVSIDPYLSGQPYLDLIVERYGG